MLLEASLVDVEQVFVKEQKNLVFIDYLYLAGLMDFKTLAAS